MSKDIVVDFPAPEAISDPLTELLRQGAKRLIQHCWPSIQSSGMSTDGAQWSAMDISRSGKS